MARKTFLTATATLLAGTVLVTQGIVGLKAEAQTQGWWGGMWQGITSWWTGTPRTVTDPALASGNYIVQWPDRSELVVNRDGYVVGQIVERNGERVMDTHLVSAAQPGYPATANVAYIQQPDGTIEVASTPGLQQGGLYTMRRDTPVAVRAGKLAPGKIGIDEYGRRVQVNREGEVVTNSFTPVSLVSEYGPGTQLVYEKAMDPTFANRVFGPEDYQFADNHPTVIPPNASAQILAQGSTVSGVTPVAQAAPIITPAPVVTAPPVAVVVCPPGDRAIIQAFVEQHMFRANMSPNLFDNLTPEQQRQVVRGEAVTMPVAGAVPSYAIPTDIQQQFRINNALSPLVIDRYGVALPTALETQLEPLPFGYQRMIFGRHVVLLSPDSVIVDMLPNVFG